MGVLHALGIHDVDIAGLFFGESIPESVICWSRSYYRNYPDEIANFLLKFSNGKTFSAYESWLNPINEKVRNITIVGSRASAFVDYLIPDVIKVKEAYLDAVDLNNIKLVEEGSRIIRVDYKEPLKEELQHFIESSKKGTKNNADGRIGAKAVFIIEKAIESLNKKQEITLDHDEIKI